MTILRNMQIIDVFGNPLGQSNNAPLLVGNQSFGTMVARGLVEGASEFRGAGEANIINAQSAQDIWDAYSPSAQMQPMLPAVGTTLKVRSTDPADSASGTGVRSIILHTLDISGLMQDVPVTLNGTTPVTVQLGGSTYVATFIQCGHANTVGAAGVAVGDIKVEDAVTGTLYKQISQGQNRCLSSIRKVPANKTLYISSWIAGGDARASGTVRLMATSLVGTLTQGFIFQSSIDISSGQGPNVKFEVPLKIPSNALVKCSVWTTGGTYITTSWEGWIE